jgi:hypothetical protein
MTTGTTLLLATVTLAVICVAVSAASKRPGAIRSYYHFDGGSLVKGPPPASGPYLAVQDRAVPVILSGPAGTEATGLPPGMGALAGICFIRTAGGKLTGNSGFSPSPDLPLALSSGGKVVLRTRTDKSGFFVAVLPAGVYRIGSGAFIVEANIESGNTTLVALQAGKRMVD